MLNLLQQRPTKKELVDDAKFFALLNAGLIATALGIALFKTPNHFAFGGTSGLSIILSTLFPKWNVGFFMWVVNAAWCCWASPFWACVPWAGPSIPPLRCPSM